MIKDEMIKSLKEIGLNEKQVIEVLFLYADVEKDAEVLRQRKNKDREAQAQRRASLSTKPNQSEKSADVLRQESNERKWAVMLERWNTTGKWPYRSPKPGMAGCEIPAEFTQNFRARSGANRTDLEGVGNG
jgi:hypothetical protein